MLESTKIVDSNNIEVKVGNIINFTYSGINVDAIVKRNKNIFILESPNNEPLSCVLSDIDSYVDTFTIKG